MQTIWPLRQNIVQYFGEMLWFCTNDQLVGPPNIVQTFLPRVDEVSNMPALRPGNSLEGATGLPWWASG